VATLGADLLILNLQFMFIVLYVILLYYIIILVIFYIIY